MSQRRQPRRQPQQLDQQRREAIDALFREAGVGPGVCIRSAAVARAAAAAADLADDSLEWILTTELPATVWDWERYDFVSEILLADGMRIPESGQVPLLDSHSRYSALDVLGHVRDFGTAQVGEFAARTGRVRFAADETSQIVRSKVSDGHITDGSVGYRVDNSIWIPEQMTVSVGGRSFTGPVKISSTWSLKEFSITPIGADVLAKVRRLCGGSNRR